MSVLLSRDGRDITADVTPSGDGFVVSIGGREHEVEGVFGGQMRVRIDDRPVQATLRREGPDIVADLDGHAYVYRVRDPRAPRVARRDAGVDTARGEVHAPMPGLVVEVMVSEGETVEAGQAIVVVEAMKMQNALTAPVAGRVTTVRVASGATVESGALLLAIRPEEG